MHNWTKDEMEEYEDYLDSLSDLEFQAELKFIELIGKAKEQGKAIVPYESEYVC